MGKKRLYCVFASDGVKINDRSYHETFDEAVNASDRFFELGYTTVTIYDRVSDCYVTDCYKEVK